MSSLCGVLATQFTLLFLTLSLAGKALASMYTLITLGVAR